MEIYLAKEGDTFQGIAGQFGLRTEQLAADNGLSVDSPLAVGQAVVLLFPDREAEVKAGDTLFTLAARYGTTVTQLLRNNPQLRGRFELFPGQTLVISYSQPRAGRFAVTGYAYAYVEEEVLRRTLPYLTYLSIFGYGVTADGGLVPLDDDRALRLAREYGVGAVMLLCSVDETGGFSSGNFVQVLADISAQERLLDAVVRNMQEKGYIGLDLDFEYIPPEYETQYTDFVRRASERMRNEGYFVLTALAPKTSAEQRGLLYEAHNYAALGEAGSYVLLMTYEWGYGGGPAMAVAPINKVGEVVRFAVGEIPPHKINLGVPMYGYDWPLPYVKGESRTTSIGCREAEELAIRVGVPISFDETAQSPFFLYTEDGVEHEVWFEDARSFLAKFRLAADYSLNGLGYWSIMRFYQPNWSVLNALYQIDRANIR